LEPLAGPKATGRNVFEAAICLIRLHTAGDYLRQTVGPMGQLRS
jgi:hypothetical protein